MLTLLHSPSNPLRHVRRGLAAAQSDRVLRTCQAHVSRRTLVRVIDADEVVSRRADLVAAILACIRMFVFFDCAYVCTCRRNTASKCGTDTVPTFLPRRSSYTLPRMHNESWCGVVTLPPTRTVAFSMRSQPEMSLGPFCRADKYVHVVFILYILREDFPRPNIYFQTLFFLSTEPIK